MMTSQTEPLTTTDPIPSTAAAAAFDRVAETAGELRLLLQDVQAAALDRDGDDMADGAERALVLQAEFAGRYRAWMAARQAPGRARPPAGGAVCDNSSSF
jgi:hypothetical protein